MFFGRYSHTIDQKGRISIPSRFRNTMSENYDDRLVVTNNTEQCLDAYPYEEWKKLLAEAPKSFQSQRDREDFQRFVVGGATECAIDRQGRILIPPVLREYAALEREVFFVGAINKFEIWNKAKYEEQLELTRERLQEAKAEKSPKS